MNPTKPFFQNFIDCISKDFANFSGRARRSEYWFFQLGKFALILIFLLPAMGFSAKNITSFQDFNLFFETIFLICIVGFIIPNFAVTVRRLHDIGKSGWMYFVSFIPIIGAIWLLIMLFTDSESKANRWGKSPKYNKGDDNFIDSIGKDL